MPATRYQSLLDGLAAEGAAGLRPGADAPDRRESPVDAGLWLTADNGPSQPFGTCGQPQASLATDNPDGPTGAVSGAMYQSAGRGPSDLSLPAAGACHRSTQSVVGHLCDLHTHGMRVHVPGGHS